MHEIITLQLGHQANYVATHFWNTQESYFTYSANEAPSPVNHDVHFRPGIGVDGGETFTPRTLIYDLKGGFGSMRKINALYEIEEAANGGLPTELWDHGTMVQREPVIEPSQYQKHLDGGLSPPPLTTDSIRYWSDYNRVFYHPRSSVQFSDYTHDSAVTPFYTFQRGKDLFNKENSEDELLDRDFRPFAEECDQMQGIQVIMTADDAWTGFGAEYVSALRDEYGKIGIITWGIEDGARVSRDKQIQRTISLANALTTIIPTTSLYVPFRSPPTHLPSSITLDPTSPWHTSALISAAIETATLPTRLRDVEGVGLMGTFNDLSMLLNVSGGQKISMLKMTLNNDSREKGMEINDARIPDGHGDKKRRVEREIDEIEMSWEEDKGSSRGFRGRVRNGKEHVFARAEVRRGFGLEEKEDEDIEMGYGDERGPVVGRYHNDFTYPIIDSFPRIFNFISSQPTTFSGDGKEEKPQLNVSTTLTSSSRVISRIRGIREIVSRMVGVDERESLGNELAEIAEGFLPGWDSGSDSDENE